MSLKTLSYLFILLLSLGVSSLSSAKNVYIDSHLKPTSQAKAEFYVELPLQKTEESQRWKIDIYNKDSQKIRFQGELTKPALSGNLIGDYRYFYANGQVQISGTFDGKEQQTGIEKRFDKQGHLVALSHFAHGKRTGLNQTYYLSGKPKIKAEYVKGQRHGIYQRFNKAGQLIEQRHYQHGKLDGISESFYPNGQRRKAIPYVKGQKEGKQTQYNREGQLSKQELFHQDKRIESRRYFKTYMQLKKYNREGQEIYEQHIDHNGASTYEKTNQPLETKRANQYWLITERHIKNGVIIEQDIRNTATRLKTHEEYNAEGTLTHSDSSEYDTHGNNIRQGRYYALFSHYLYPDTKMETEYFYQDDQLNGPYKKVTLDGKFLETGQYKDNHKVGLWLYKYSDSGTTKENYAEDGHKEGLFEYVQTDGQLRYRKHYHQGKLDGDYEKYSKTGELIGKGNYRQGKKQGHWTFKDRRYPSLHYVIHGEFNQGIQVGQWETRTQAGELVEKHNYDATGKLDGAQYYYDENGKQAGVRYYHHGEYQKIAPKQ